MAIDNVRFLRQAGSMAPPTDKIRVLHHAERRYQTSCRECTLNTANSRNRRTKIGRWFTGMKHQLANSQDLVQRQKRTRINYLKDYSTPQRSLVSYIPEVFTLVDRTEGYELDIPDIPEFITAHSADEERRFAAATVWKPKTFFIWYRRCTCEGIASAQCVTAIVTCSTNTLCTASLSLLTHVKISRRSIDVGPNATGIVLVHMV